MLRRWLPIALTLVLTLLSFVAPAAESGSKPLQWQWVNPPMGVSHLYDAAYGNGRWVVVGGELLLTSTDSVSWEAVPLSGSGNLRRVIFAGGQFVVAGTNLLLTSTDGKTWINRLTGNQYLSEPWGIAYGNGAYAVLTAKSAYRSTDGVTWAEYLIPSRQGDLLQVTFGAGRFVAVGESGSIHTSVDGVRWSQAASPATSRLTAATYAGGKFLIGGDSFTLLSSQDGLSWKQEAPVVPNAQPGSYFMQFVPMGERVLGLYYSMDTSVLSSTDGVTWELLMPPQDPSIYALAVAGGQLLAVGRAGMVLSSTDGRLWAPRLGGTGMSFTQVAYGNGRFVAIGFTNHSGAIYSSEDGNTWTLRSGGAEQMRTLLFAEGRFLATSNAGTFFTSVNGEDWISQTFGVGPSAMGYGLGRYVGLGAFGGAVTSTDGEVWEAFASAIPTWIISLTYGNGLFVAADTEGNIYTSADGRSWTRRETGPRATLNASAFGNGRFVVGGDTDSVLVSTDGVAWSRASIGLRIAGLTFMEGRFVGVASQGQVIESNDGLVWRNAGSLPGGRGQPVSVAYGNGRYVAVGYDGLIAATGDAPVPRVYAISAATVDPGRSSIEVDRAIVPPDGETRAKIRVALRDGQGIPVSGHLVELVPHGDIFGRGGLAAVTDQHGVATISIWSAWNDRRGTVTFSAADVNSNARLGPAVSVTFSTCAGLFPDIPRQTEACRAAEELAMRKLVSGFPDGRFYPDRGLTRAELAKLAVNAAGAEPLRTRPLPFSDTNGHWAAESGFIQAAMAMGAMTGFPDGSFRPDEPVTRAMLMKVVLVVSGSPVLPYESSEFTDVARTAWYAPYMAGSIRAGLMEGPGRFRAFLPPQFKGEQAVTRREAVLVIGNLLISRGTVKYILVSD